ncbi:hypothetical protein ACHAXT_003240 [Thalassiosira profunda]
MVNDGGLRDVLQTAELVSKGLVSLDRRGSSSTTAASAGAKRKPSRSLSEGSGNTDRSVRLDLGRHAPSELKEVATPLIHKLEALDAAALLSLNPSKNGRGATLDKSKGLTVPPVHDRVSPQYKDRGNNIVRYLHVKEVPRKFSAGIFVFPPGAEIPLHDHPEMVVLSRVLYGELQVQSYDVMRENADEVDQSESVSADRKKQAPNSPSALTSPFRKIRDLVFRSLSVGDDEEDDDIRGKATLHATPNPKPMGVQDDAGPATISAPSVTCLYPYEGNCHSFVAGPQGAAVLDILLPPYDAEEDRDCTFYEAHEDGRPSKARKLNEEDGAYTLTPIHQPEDFHCLSGSYGRFGTCNTYEDVAEEG